jgi:hypothetical protein
MPVRTVLAAFAVSLLLATPGSAQDDEEYPVDPTLEGIYIGSSMGASWDKFDTSGVSGDFGTSMISSLILGYRASEYLSTEIEFEWLSGFRSGDDELDGWLTSLGFRVHFPIGQIEPYLTYGGAILHIDGRGATLGTVGATDFAITGGGGLAYHWTDQFSVFAEGIYTWPIGGVEGFDHGSLRFGLLYKFAQE